jgi:hypothetical protein
MAEEKKRDSLTPLDFAALLTLLGQSLLRGKEKR